MSFLTSAMKAGKAVGVPLGKLAVGGTMGRMALGGAIGGIYGAATNPYNDPEMGLGRIARLATLGALAGGSTRLFSPAVKFGANGMTSSGMPLGMRALGSLGKSAPGMTKAGISSGATLAGMAVNNPLTTLGIVGGAYALNQTNKTPYDSEIADSVVNQPVTEYSHPNNSQSSEEEMLGRMNNGISPMGGMMGGTQIRNQRLMQSTMGLTQGLHRGRHG